MNAFWHFDAGNLSVLGVALATYYKVSIMHYQHKMMWRDFESRHGIGPKSKMREA